MRYLIIVAVLLAGCSTFNRSGPSSAQLAKLCIAEGNSMRTLGGCLEGKIDATYPGWRYTREEPAISYLIAYAKALGRRVTALEMTNDAAQQEFFTENGNIVRSKHAEAASQSNNNSAEMVMAGAALINAGRPVYAPAPQVVYPNEPVIINQAPNAAPYRFIDSRPYK